MLAAVWLGVARPAVAHCSDGGVLWRSGAAARFRQWTASSDTSGEMGEVAQWLLSDQLSFDDGQATRLMTCAEEKR
jgi:hypothetical protein